MKKVLMICLLILQILTFTGCNKEEESVINTIYGTNVLISGKTGDGVYVKNYKIMDCCDEYNTITPLVKDLENAAAYEIYDLDLFDETGNECQPAGKINVQFMLSKNLIAANGDKYSIFLLKDNELTEMESDCENGVISFNTEEFGVYTIVKFGDNSDGIDFTINGCDGTCKTCQ